MNRASKVLMLAIVSALGIWGCAGGSGNAGADRAKVLEARVAKLEEDFHTAATARDLLAQKLEKEMAQLQLLVKERDDLRQQVGIRTTERDTVQTNYDQFRKSIRSLLGETETASGSPAKTVTFAADIEPLVN